jgi:methylglyoxal/glyoxal reductase
MLSSVIFKNQRMDKATKTQSYTTLNNGSKMPLFGLGAWDMYGKEVEQAVLDALEIGYRLIDTATAYNNEKEIGNALRQSGVLRGEIFVTTKIPNPQQGYDSTLRAFDASMKALNIDYIDLYLVHWPIKGKRKDTWKALEKLFVDKRVRAIGVANYLIPFLKELETYCTIVPAVNQIEFSPWLFLKKEFEYCKEHNIQLQSYSPLTRGQKLNDPQLLRLCKKYRKTPAQIILRWNIEHEISTIPKSSNKKRLQENFDIFDFSLTKEDVALMDSFNENFRVVEDPIHML